MADGDAKGWQEYAGGFLGRFLCHPLAEVGAGAGVEAGGAWAGGHAWAGIGVAGDA